MPAGGCQRKWRGAAQPERAPAARRQSSALMRLLMPSRTLEHVGAQPERRQRCAARPRESARPQESSGDAQQQRPPSTVPGSRGCQAGQRRQDCRALSRTCAGGRPARRRQGTARPRGRQRGARAAHTSACSYRNWSAAAGMPCAEQRIPPAGGQHGGGEARRGREGGSAAPEQRTQAPAHAEAGQRRQECRALSSTCAGGRPARRRQGTARPRGRQRGARAAHSCDGSCRNWSAAAGMPCAEQRITPAGGQHGGGEARCGREGGSTAPEQRHDHSWRRNMLVCVRHGTTQEFCRSPAEQPRRQVVSLRDVCRSGYTSR